VQSSSIWASATYLATHNIDQLVTKKVLDDVWYMMTWAKGDMVTDSGDADWRTSSSVGSRITTTEIALIDPPADADPGVQSSLIWALASYLATHNIDQLVTKKVLDDVWYMTRVETKKIWSKRNSRSEWYLTDNDLASSTTLR
jgi:hypothetical protein